ncbi:DNA (cytosine-5-)-methyltransferase [Nocardiopsis sp. RSe5-2]|uniref:DNA (cytosine-5-)-methyltransferase n=1 Tax=Nocardiopsis endophytica TaxID=3018445 RepID=A0ABT4TXI2_9ACTN|nr:DNA (cytosine-5-)-methyltransferase [Nocardiopsis endophytica]MDA2809399.1 DNA (cytosine-5-)-methyltransferase [Nocardiopsis endophytica]
MNSNLPVVSLFSGAGGLDCAVERCGEPPLVHDNTGSPLRVAVATDYDETALQTLSLNFPHTKTLCGDIRDTSTSDILAAGGLSVGDPTLVVGGPPCTPFSKSGFWVEEKRNSSDPNASLLDDYVRVVRESKPEAFILENVQGLTYKTHKAQFDRLMAGLTAAGYNPTYKVLLAAEYGVPQLRRRVFVVGRRDGKKFHFPETTHSGESERDRIVDSSKLPFVSARTAFKGIKKEKLEDSEIVEGTYADLAAEVPPGQNYLWHTDRYGGKNVFRWRSRYWTFLLKLDPERPSTTLQAQPGPWVGPFHWSNVRNARGDIRARRLRISEMKRLMTFPDEFEFVGGKREAQRQLGNAVPVELGKVVIRSLMEQLGYMCAEQPSSVNGTQISLL